MIRAVGLLAAAGLVVSWITLSAVDVRADDSPKATAESTDGHVPTPTKTATATQTAKAGGDDDVTRTAHETETARPTSAVTLKTTFVEAKGGVATWRLEPTSAADLIVWDSSAAGCTGFNGAVCGSLASGNSATFSSASAGQYLLVTQAYVQNGESCHVVHQAQYAPPGGSDARQSVTGTYVCSGAPVLGFWWVLFGFAGAVGVAWYVRRAHQ